MTTIAVFLITFFGVVVGFALSYRRASQRADRFHQQASYDRAFREYQANWDDPNARMIYMSQIYGLGCINRAEFDAEMAAQMERKAQAEA